MGQQHRPCRARHSNPDIKGKLDKIAEWDFVDELLYALAEWGTLSLDGDIDDSTYNHGLTKAKAGVRGVVMELDTMVAAALSKKN